jgi:uncharacterized membrane protein
MWSITFFGFQPLLPFASRPIGIPAVIIHEFLVALGNMPNQIQQEQQRRPYPLVFSIFVMIFTRSVESIGICFKKEQQVTSGVDLFATVMALAGVSQPPQTSGKPIVDDELKLFPQGSHNEVYCEWEHRRSDDKGKPMSLRCLRSNDYKLVYDTIDGEGELYDYAKDPNEFFNVYNDDAYASVKAELTLRLANRYIAKVPHTPCECGW